jgi:hypothetical protein
MAEVPAKEAYNPLRQKFQARVHTTSKAEVPAKKAYKPLRQKFPPRKHINL